MADTALVNLALPMMLAIIMFGMGMTLTPQDFSRVVRQPRAALIALFGQFLVLPGLALVVATLMDLSPPMQVGLMLIAACPGGAMSNLICHLACGNVALSISLTAVSSLLTLITIPIVVGLSLAIFGGGEATIQMPVLQTILTLLGIVVVPVLMGMVVRGHAAAFAERSERHFSILSLAFMILLIIAIVLSERATLGSALVEVGPAVLLLNCLAVLAGLLLGLSANLPRRDVVTLCIEVGIQNSTLAILLALTVIGQASLAIPAGVYGLLMYASAFVLIAWARRSDAVPKASRA